MAAWDDLIKVTITGAAARPRPPAPVYPLDGVVLCREWFIDEFFRSPRFAFWAQLGGSEELIVTHAEWVDFCDRHGAGGDGR